MVISIHGHGLAQATKSTVDHPPNGHNSPYRVSIPDLIIRPKYYDSSPMQVVGYLRFDGVGEVLYFNADDSNKPKNNYGVLLYLAGLDFKKAMKYERHYILVEGKFYANMFHRKGYCGSMLGITRLSLLHKESTIYK
jgi:hypothetical protein